MARFEAIAALLPLVIFYLVESNYGLQAGVLAAIGWVLVDLPARWWFVGRINKLVVFSAVLVIGLGSLSLASDDERFVLYTPVIGDLVFAGVLVVSLLRGQSLLVWAMKEQDPDVEIDPPLARFLTGVTWRFAANLTLHALLTAIATTQSREVWLFVSGPLQYGMMGIQVLGEALYGRFTLPPVSS